LPPSGPYRSTTSASRSSPATPRWWLSRGDRYGKAVGRVAAVGPIPVDDERLQELTGDASLVGLTRNMGPTREVRIALTRADTPSGLAWTGGPGPSTAPPLGVRALSSITIRRETLIGKVLG